MNKINKEFQDKYIIYVPETDEGYIGSVSDMSKNVEEWVLFIKRKYAEQSLEQYINNLKKQIKKLLTKKKHIEKNTSYNFVYLEINDEIARLEKELKLMETAVVKKVKITLTEVEEGE